MYYVNDKCTSFCLVYTGTRIWYQYCQTRPIRHSIQNCKACTHPFSFISTSSKGTAPNWNPQPSDCKDRTLVTAQCCYSPARMVLKLSYPLYRNWNRINPFRPHMPKRSKTCEKNCPRWDSNPQPQGSEANVERVCPLTSSKKWSVCGMCAKFNRAVYGQWNCCIVG